MTPAPGGGREAPDAPPPVWRQREYLLLWGAQPVSHLGSDATGIICPLLLIVLAQQRGARSRRSA